MNEGYSAVSFLKGNPVVVVLSTIIYYLSFFFFSFDNDIRLSLLVKSLILVLSYLV